MPTLRLGLYIGYCFWLTVLTVGAFAALRWLNISSGHLIDWIIGIATSWWLLVIVTVPWNVYFEAKTLADEADHSKSLGIAVDEPQIKYVKGVSSKALILAITLHIVSAAGLFALSANGITPVGYIGSGAALLLTILRPMVRAYEYLWQRLAAIRQRIKYPREDVIELRNRMQSAEQKVKGLESQLDASNPNSFAAMTQRSREDFKIRLENVVKEQNQMRDQNAREHERLARDAQLGIAKLSADSQFLDHVREIVRLIKSA